MSEHEVSRLERSPDALRTVDIPTDPALEDSHQDHKYHQDHLELHHLVQHADGVSDQDHMHQGGVPHSDHIDQDGVPHPDHMLQDGIPHQDHMHHHGHHEVHHEGHHEGHHEEMHDEMSSPDHQEPFSPRRGYTHKRVEEPERNAQGKMLCKFQSSCSSLVFDRRCEWSKHMDKHDRPYKCSESGCEKLQGFTYSGGLLRHQREVHKMHGGTKKALYCPEPNCKRNSGSGFTRKENLSEHIRRVHRRVTDGTDIGIAAQAQNGLDQLEATAAAAVATEEDELVSDGIERPSKRKRDDDYMNGDGLPGGVDFGIEDTAVKRLRNENEELKERMKQMEQNMAQQVAMLQELLNRSQPPAPTASMV